MEDEQSEIQVLVRPLIPIEEFLAQLEAEEAEETGLGGEPERIAFPQPRRPGTKSEDGE